MDTAITLLQHLATLALHDGEPCAQVLFQAADYLQDMADCAPGLDDPEAASSAMAELDILMAGLGTMLPEGAQRLGA